MKSKVLVLRRGLAHLEAFNGSDAMLSIRKSVDERKGAGPHEAILTVRDADDSVWTRTITIPLFL
jgi:hypothetical protein